MNIRKRGHEKLSVFLALALSLAIAMISCKDKKPASISGRIVNTLPQGQEMAGIEIAAIRDGQVAGSGKVNPKTGEYLISSLNPGVYDLRLKTPVGVLMFAYSLQAKSGEETKAPDIDLPPDAFPAPTQPQPASSNNESETSALTPPPGPTVVTREVKPPTTRIKGTVSIKGTVHPPDAAVAVLDGTEVVAQSKAVNGKFEVPDLKPGLYNVEFSAPDYGTEQLENVAVSPQGATGQLNGFLLYKSPLDGVDFGKGLVTATGLGKPNPNMPPAQSSIMACRAARVVAYRNLLDTLLSLQVEKGKSVRSMDTSGKVKKELQGFVQGARTVKENKRPDGFCEVTLELNLYGESGVIKFIQNAIGK